MQIIFAERMGFCRGVRRAFDATIALAQALANDERKTYILGDLVHNRQVVERVSSAGIARAEATESLANARVILRTHGETSQTIEKLREAGNEILDLTCSVVKAVREKAAQLQDRHPSVVVVGKKDHPEVEGLVSYLDNPQVVTEPEDVASLAEYPSIGVVEQTTIGRERYQRVLSALVAKYGAGNVEALDTICPHTDENQSASREIAKRCDIILVIGDTHSSNSRRLFEACREQNANSYFLSRVGEVGPAWFPPPGDPGWGTLRVGITAGASTPDWAVNEIAEQVRELGGEMEQRGKA